MKKKLKKLLAMTLIAVTLISNTVLAAETIDGSILTHDDESIGNMEVAPRGIYLQSGYSEIGKLGTGLIRASGTTTAQMSVSSVKVVVIVEKYIGGQWLQYTSWTGTRNNASSVVSAKNVTVPIGYYYRVRCIHSANGESSNSQTNGLYV